MSSTVSRIQDAIPIGTSTSDAGIINEDYYPREIIENMKGRLGGAILMKILALLTLIRR
jgi:hypothetical protein